VTSKLLKESEDRDDLKIDSNRIRDFQKGLGKGYMNEIIADENKRLDELHNQFVCVNDVIDIEELQLIKKVFDFLKNN
jgi:hypothetical protein